jgi:hypothetical protein
LCRSDPFCLRWVVVSEAEAHPPAAPHRRRPKPKPPDTASSDQKYIESKFTAQGFQPKDLGPQMKGCECGQSDVIIDPASPSGTVGEWTKFTWDTHYLCRGQTSKSPDTTMTIWSDGQTYKKLPTDGFGIAELKFPRPGLYNVTVEASAYCVDTGNGGEQCSQRNFCRAKTNFSKNIAAAGAKYGFERAGRSRGRDRSTRTGCTYQ